MNDIFFSPSFISHYRQHLLRYNDGVLPVSLAEYRGMKSLLSIGYQGTMQIGDCRNYEPLHDFASKNNVITCFIRYNPLLGNHNDKARAMSYCHIADFSDIEYYHKNRPPRLRALLKNTAPLFTYSAGEGMLEKTLQYKNEYFCSMAHIDALCSSMGRPVNAMRNGSLTASSLFLEAGSTAVYAANASSTAGKNAGDNAFILMHYMEQARKRGITHLYLGSGIKKDDSLEIFKKQFSSARCDVYHERIIFDEHAYNANSKDNGYFPPWLGNVCIPDIIQGMQRQ